MQMKTDGENKQTYIMRESEREGDTDEKMRQADRLSNDPRWMKIHSKN